VRLSPFHFATMALPRNQSPPYTQPDHQDKGNEDTDSDSHQGKPLSRFVQLPTEIQLQVVRNIASERELLQFRLVCSLTDALVLDPALWQEIVFSKQLYFKVGHTSRPYRLANSPSRSPYYHNSDAGIIIHRQSLAASMLEPSYQPRSAIGEAIGRSSLHITANLARDIHPGTQMPDTSSDIRSWSSIQDSFLAFMICLSLRTPTLRRVHQIHIKDWEGKESMRSLWSTLQAFDTLGELAISHSVLEDLGTVTVQDLDSNMASPWTHLTNLELRDCVNLCNISGLLQWMPQLQELSLEGCQALEDFSPLASSSPSSETVAAQDLLYKKVNLSSTKIRDHDLIQLLERSPYLQELRLDRCYQVTDASLVAMGYGPSDPTAQQDVSLEVLEPHGIQHGERTSTSFCPRLKMLSLRDCYDLADEGVRALAGCPQLEALIIRGLRRVDERTTEWLHLQGVPLRRALSPLGQWRHWSQ
jgi:hypothetical protein